MLDKKTIVGYHNECLDGIVAADFFRLFFQKLFQGEKLEFIGFDHPVRPEQYEKLYKLAKKNTNLFFADYVLSYDETIALAEIYNKITICDHHPKAAREFLGKNLPENIDLQIDSKKCGAKIVFDYLKEITGLNVKEPVFLKYVDILDRGEIGHPDYSAASCFLDALIYKLDLNESFDAIEGIYNASEKEIIKQGRKLEVEFTKAAKNILKHPRYMWISIKEGKAPVWVPVYDNLHIRSPVGRIFSKLVIESLEEQTSGSGVAFACCERHGVKNLSVRTRRDVSAKKIARFIGGKEHGGIKGLGGGGHEQISCAQLPPEAYNIYPKYYGWVKSSHEMLARVMPNKDKINYISAAIKPVFNAALRFLNQRGAQTAKQNSLTR